MAAAVVKLVNVEIVDVSLHSPTALLCTLIFDVAGSAMLIYCNVHTFNIHPQ